MIGEWKHLENYLVYCDSTIDTKEMGRQILFYNFGIKILV